MSKDEESEKAASSEALTPEEQQKRIWTFLEEKHAASADGKEQEEDTDGLRKQWPTYDKLLMDVRQTDYNTILQCPHDVRQGTVGFSQETHQECPFSGAASDPKKVICPHGVVCCAKMELFPAPPGEAAYTGLLSAGKTVEHCLLRLSSSMKPPSHKTPRWARGVLRAVSKKLRDANLFPTAALKIFRGANVPSGNVLFGGCKLGQSETDYFAHVQCTQLTEKISPVIKPFVSTFWRYSEFPLCLGISDLCKYDVDGQPPSNNNDNSNHTDHGDVEQQQPRFPYALVVRPAMSSLSTAESDADDNDDDKTFESFLDDLQQIPEGTVLFDLFACPNPQSVTDPTKLQRIGRIVTTSHMLPSGPDDGLVFRHQRKEDDFELQPTWREGVLEEFSPDQGKTTGTIAGLAGWKLFENHIQKGVYVDFEHSSDTSVRENADTELVQSTVL